MASRQPELDDVTLPGEQPMSHLVQAAAQYVRILRYRKSVFGVTAVVCGLLGMLYFATAPRYYQAESSVLILQVGNDVSNPNMAAESAKGDIMPTYQQLAHSAVVLEDAIRRLRPEHLVDFQNVQRNGWAKQLDKNLSVSAVRQTNILDIKYRSRDPVVSVEVIKAIREAYFDFVERTYKHRAAEIVDILTREEQDIDQRLTAKKKELSDFLTANGDLGIRSGGQEVHPLVKTALTLNDALNVAMQKRLELQSSLAAVQVAVQNGENLQPHLMAIEEVVGREMLLTGLGLSERDATVQANLERALLTDRAKLESVKQYLGPAHPKYEEIAQRIQVSEKYLLDYRDRLVRSLNEMQNGQLGSMLIQSLGQSVARAVEQENMLRQSFEAAKREAVSHNGEMAMIETLEHDVKHLQEMQEALGNKIASTELQQQHGEVRLAVTKEPEVPTMPASPRLALVVAVCLLGTAVGGSIVVAVQDSLDDRFRSPEDLRSRLGLQTLAIIRSFDDAENDVPGGVGLQQVQSYTQPDSLESEAFRTLRTALAFSAGDTAKLVISSSEPGDGKTTVLANLAVSIAQSGKRTLLIDADLRRPGMTALLAMKGQAGLSDVLQSEENLEAMLERCVQHTALEMLDVLPSGPRRPNPAELLSSTRLADLLAWAESRYDQILVDAPPVLAASDALIVGRLVDGAVLVVQPEKNRRRLVTRAAESFHSVEVPLLGVVANRVGENGDQSYAYTYGYGYSYEYGESVSDEESEDGVIDDEDEELSDEYESYVEDDTTGEDSHDEDSYYGEDANEDATDEEVADNLADEVDNEQAYDDEYAPITDEGDKTSREEVEEDSRELGVYYDDPQGDSEDSYEEDYDGDVDGDDDYEEEDEDEPRNRRAA